MYLLKITQRVSNDRIGKPNLVSIDIITMTFIDNQKTRKGGSG
jgi:hypothetical protein